jgi:hypothetical protein
MTKRVGGRAATRVTIATMTSAFIFVKFETGALGETPYYAGV